MIYSYTLPGHFEHVPFLGGIRYDFPSCHGFCWRVACGDTLWPVHIIAAIEIQPSCPPLLGCPVGS